LSQAGEYVLRKYLYSFKINAKLSQAENLHSPRIANWIATNPSKQRKKEREKERKKEKEKERESKLFILKTALLEMDARVRISPY